MERDFCDYLKSLSPADQDDVLLTFAHLLDDGNLSRVTRIVQDEENRRQRRRDAVRQPVKRLVPATPQRQSGREPFKKLRIEPTATSTPNAPPVRLTRPAHGSRDLLSVLVDGHPDPLRDAVKEESVDTNGRAGEKQMFDDMSPEEEEFMMNSEDDAIVSLVAYEPDATDITKSDIMDESTVTLTAETEKPDDAVGFFVSGNRKKKEIRKTEKAVSIFQSA